MSSSGRCIGETRASRRKGTKEHWALFRLNTAFVTLTLAAVLAGCAPRGTSTPMQPGPETKEAQQPPVVGVVLREFEFEPRPLKAKAGTVRFLLINRGTVEHDFTIPSVEGHDVHDKHLVKPGKTKTFELELKPGSYEAICTIPGHKEAGMVVVVQVSS